MIALLEIISGESTEHVNERRGNVVHGDDYETWSCTTIGRSNSRASRMQSIDWVNGRSTMVSSKRRKTPVTKTGTKSRPSSTKTRSVIRKFHVLLKSRRKLEGQPGSERGLKAIDEQLSGLGGLDAYQRMSQEGQSTERGGGTEAVLIDWLKEVVKNDPLPEGQKLRWV